MTWLKTNRERRVARPFVPRLESLDERTLPVANFSVSNGTLFISAADNRFGPGRNRIVVSDNGGIGTNNVVAQSNGRTFRPNVAITSVSIRGKAGLEDITYNLTGSLVGSRTVNVELGGNSDSFDLTVRRDFTTNSQLDLNVLGGAGDDSIRTTLIGNMTLASRFNYCAMGGADNDEVSFRTTSAVAVGASSSLTMVMRGAGGADTVRTEYNGILNGSLAFLNDGGGGNDDVRALVSVFGGSIGLFVPSRVEGAAGDDSLRFIVNNSSAIAVTFNQVIDGGTGFNECVRTNDVAGFRCQDDRVV